MPEFDQCAKKITMVNSNDVSVKETKEKSDNLAWWQKIVPAFLEDIMFWNGLDSSDFGEHIFGAICLGHMIT